MSTVLCYIQILKKNKVTLIRLENEKRINDLKYHSFTKIQISVNTEIQIQNNKLNLSFSILSSINICIYTTINKDGTQ